ncbi:uncharacterized protein EV420DRAFT_1482140 [Desarmillaria tabescens]|uniref:Uncharacterized protein n=1 Tax=Armillaria tabescens TaxID=1929756 RepID=A0AA39K1L4_ARMTA|nr:uncharacterized protein EV420DRAFT_1482140 [Desarmillaria tabescens]KAK0452845.1 hypothetical protein EV420DRAFT_1482140 [Desarmillaria tabescens]
MDASYFVPPPVKAATYDALKFRGGSLSVARMDATRDGLRPEDGLNSEEIFGFEPPEIEPQQVGDSQSFEESSLLYSALSRTSGASSGFAVEDTSLSFPNEVTESSGALQSLCISILFEQLATKLFSGVQPYESLCMLSAIQHVPSYITPNTMTYPGPAELAHSPYRALVLQYEPIDVTQSHAWSSSADTGEKSGGLHPLSGAVPV